MGFVGHAMFAWSRTVGAGGASNRCRGLTRRRATRDEDGRARSRSFTTKAEAQELPSRASADIQRGDYIDPIKRRRHSSEWAHTWWATTVKLRPTTRRDTGSFSKTTCCRTSGGGQWQRRLPRCREVHRRQDRGGPVAEKGQGRSISHLVGNEMRRPCQRPEGQPSGRPPAVGLKHKLRPGHVPDMADIERLVAGGRDPYKPAVWLLAFTGMRPSELCGLRVRSIDFTRPASGSPRLCYLPSLRRIAVLTVGRHRKRTLATETSPSRHGFATTWPPCSPDPGPTSTKA